MHPATYLLVALSFIAISSRLPFPQLATAAALLACVAILRADRGVWNRLRRARWLLAISPIIYGYTVPGQGLIAAADSWSPTWEGLAAGAEQSLRLITILLALCWMLNGLGPQQLMVGLKTIFKPLDHVGIDTIRASRRLALTLAYLQQLDKHKVSSLIRTFSMPGSPPHKVVLPPEPVLAFTWRDGLLLMLVSGLSIALLT